MRHMAPFRGKLLPLCMSPFEALEGHGASKCSGMQAGTTGPSSATTRRCWTTSSSAPGGRRCCAAWICPAAAWRAPQTSTPGPTGGMPAGGPSAQR